MMKKKYLFYTTIIVLLTACGPDVNRGPTADSTDEALVMLEAIFEGAHGKFAIEEMMDTVLTLYNVELIKENYLKIGNILVEKRKSSDGSITEMNILTHMIGVNAGRRGGSCEDQINKSFRALQASLKETVDASP